MEGLLVSVTILLGLQSVRIAGAVKIGVILKPDLNIVQSAYEGVMYNYSNSNVAQEIKFKVKTNFATLEDTDLFSTSRTLCEQLRTNVTTVVVSSTSHSSLALQSLFKNTNVPYVATSYQEHCSVNVGGNLNLPSADSLGVSLLPDYLPAVSEMVDHMQWPGFIYVYDSENGPSKLQRLLSHTYRNPVTVRFVKRITNSSDANDFLRMLETTDRESRKHVLLDCRFDVARRIIVDHVRDIYMGRRNYHFFLVNPVVNELTYDKIPEFAAVNITALRLVSEDVSQQSSMDPSQEPREKRITLEEALIQDAASLIVETYKGLKLRSVVPHRYSYIFEDHEDDDSLAAATRRDGGPSAVLQPPRLEAELLEEGAQAVPQSDAPHQGCGERPSVPQELGEIITKHLRGRSFQGLTGPIRFTNDGCRIDYKVHIVQLNTTNEAFKVAEWSDTKAFEPVVKPLEPLVNITEELNKDRVYLVQSVLDKPYLMVRDSIDELERTGNDRYEGFCKDLMDALARELHIKYELRAAEETVYGRRDHKVQGGWTGLIGQVVRKEVDMGVAATLVKAERREVVDFSLPFLETGTVALVLRTEPVLGRGMLTFLAPFSFELWIFFVTGLAVVMIVMFLVSFFTARASAAAEKPGVERHTSGALFKSLCYTLEAFTPHYIDSYYARSIAGRLIGNVWWLFVVFVFSAYTASLVPFLSTETMPRRLATADDLADQTAVEYGFTRQSSARNYFENPNLNSSVHKRMWETMNNRPHVFTASDGDGVERVRSSKGRYAFFMDANKADYISSQRPCDTATLGEPFGRRNFAVALPKDSALRMPLDEAIARLTETGELLKLKKKWWTEKSVCQEVFRKDGLVMTLENFLGVFFILGGGVALGLLVGFIEIVYRACARSSSCTKGEDAAPTEEAQIPEKEYIDQPLACA
ncbi:glutamate receptor 1-like [Dermacentor albipictus]|uniref:glutamate receptor 1-like n=1 Tax=Dermacentor albipictus TaxID=60249 RepID=UPI0038FC1836